MKRSGVFKNSAVGMVPAGVFRSQALGTSGGVFQKPTALGGLGGGIFTGPTALGISLEEGMPTDYDSCMSDCEGDEQCEQVCLSLFGGSGTRDTATEQAYQATEGKPCSSESVIRVVQGAIGAGVDGKWGTESQGKLDAKGLSYQIFAPGCTGAAPVASGGSGYLTPVQLPASSPPQVQSPEEPGVFNQAVGFLTSDFHGVPVAAWAIGATLIAAIGISVIRAREENVGF